jgi:hypothetical protein
MFDINYKFLRMNFAYCPLVLSAISQWQVGSFASLTSKDLACNLLRYKLSSSGISMAVLADQEATRVGTALAIDVAVRKLPRSDRTWHMSCIIRSEQFAVLTR